MRNLGRIYYEGKDVLPLYFFNNCKKQKQENLNYINNEFYKRFGII